MICKFKKTTVIEAIRFTGTKESFDEIRAWVGDGFFYDYQNAPRVFLDQVDNFSSSLPVNIDDWVVKMDNKFKVMTDVDMSYFTKVVHEKKAVFKVKVEE